MTLWRLARERLLRLVKQPGKVSRPGVIPGPTVKVRIKRERDSLQGCGLTVPVKSLSLRNALFVAKQECVVMSYVLRVTGSAPVGKLRVGEA
jgi:hypothetical protein